MKSGIRQSIFGVALASLFIVVLLAPKMPALAESGELDLTAAPGIAAATADGSELSATEVQRPKNAPGIKGESDEPDSEEKDASDKVEKIGDAPAGEKLMGERASRRGVPMVSTQSVESGTCGDTIEWEFDESTGTLTLTGEGPMYDFTESPWAEGYEGIQKIVVSEGISSIGAHAFDSLFDVVSAQIADSVELIGFRAFGDCWGLRTVSIPLNWTMCSPEVDAEEENYDTCGHIFAGCGELAELSVPEGVTELPAFAFNGCDCLQKVTLPSSLTEIGHHAFFDCGEMREVVVPEGVTAIGKSAFCYCGQLTDVTLPDTLTDLELFAFYQCYSLESIVLPDNLERIGYRAFAECTALKDVKVPLHWNECPSANEDGEVDADGCGQIFLGCESLTSITIPEGMTEIPGYAFNESDYLEEVVFPDSLTNISNHAFYKCRSLKGMAIPGSVACIGKAAFGYCGELKNVTISDGTRELKHYSFYECYSLEAVELPDSIEAIGYMAFAGCSVLSEVTIPRNWKECPSSSDDGTVSSYYCGHIFENCPYLQQIAIPDGMETLPVYAFCYSNGITTVILPDSFKSFPKCAFYECDSLTYVKYPDSVESVGTYAFAGCDSLRAVVFPKSTTTVGSNAYEECYNLAAVSIPKNLTSIGEDAFEDCYELARVYYEGNEEEWQALLSGTASRALATQASIGSSITELEVTYGVLCDYAEPDHIIDYHYERPSDTSPASFYGGGISGDLEAVDIEEASFGNYSKTTAISLPKESYITYGFKTALLCESDSVILITTTGNNGSEERAEIYVETLSGELQYVDTIYEYSERHTVSLSNVDDPITGVKVVGKDLGGDWPGFDIVDIALMAKDTGEEYSEDSKTTVNLQCDGHVYNLLKREKVFDEGDEKTASIHVTADWGDSPHGSVMLVQNGETILAKQSGDSSGVSFVDIKPGQLFAPDETIYLVLTTEKDGESKVFERRVLKLTVVPNGNDLLALDDSGCRTSTKSLDETAKNIERILKEDKLRRFRQTLWMKSSGPGISEVIPGMRQTHVRNMKSGKDEACKSMCPQGVCTIGDYRLISAYCTEKEHESVLYVLDAGTGEYLTTLLLNGNQCHAGAIASGKGADGKQAVFLVDSGENDSNASRGTIWSLRLSAIQSAVNKGSDCCVVSLNKLFGVDLNPSFLCYFRGKLLVGNFWGNKVLPTPIDEINYNLKSYMYVFDTSTGVRSEIKVALPRACQGVEVYEFRGSLYVFASCSTALNLWSRVFVGKLIPTDDGWFANAPYKGKAPRFGGFNFPVMCEDLDVRNETLRTCYESAANKYRSGGYGLVIDPLDRITETIPALLIKRYMDGDVDGFEQNPTWGSGGSKAQSANAASAGAAGMRTLAASDPEGEDAYAIASSGSCGEDAYWALYGDGALELSGYGDMDDYPSSSQAPWADHVSEISAVYIDAGIEHIGAHAFEGCASLASVSVSQYIPAGTTLSIGDCAFAGCTALERISLPDGVELAYGDDALPAGCTEHVHEYEMSGHVEPTCANPGYDLYVCECGAEEARELEDPISHTYELAGETAATCETPGVKTYVCSVCETPAYEEIEPLGHSWGKPKWSWSADRGSATATFTCAKDGSHVEAVSAKVTSADSNGLTIYTATAELDGASYSDTATAGIAIGKTAVADGCTYRVTGSAAVALVKAKNAKNVAVPATVTLNGKAYEVVQVNANAFKGAKIRTVTIGENVAKLAGKAFNKSKVTKVVVKSKHFKKPSSVKGCFKGAKKLKTVQVKVGSKAQNKKFAKAYKKTLGKKGVSGKKVTVK